MPHPNVRSAEIEKPAPIPQKAARHASFAVTDVNFLRALRGKRHPKTSHQVIEDSGCIPSAYVAPRLWRGSREMTYPYEGSSCRISGHRSASRQVWG